MILYGETVGLVLNAGNQLEAFGMNVYGKLHVVKIDSSGPVVVILHHTADGYI